MEARAEDEGEIKSLKPGLGKVVGFLARAVCLAALPLHEASSNLNLQGSNGLQNLGLVHDPIPGGSHVHNWVSPG